jgi:hypothetical protein
VFKLVLAWPLKKKKGTIINKCERNSGVGNTHGNVYGTHSRVTPGFRVYGLRAWLRKPSS